MVNIILDVFPFFYACFPDLLTVFIRTSAEKDFTTIKALVSGDGVSLHQLQRKTDMGICVYIWNSGCNIEAIFFHYYLPLFSCVRAKIFLFSRSLKNSITITAAGIASTNPQNPLNSKPIKADKMITIGESPTIFLIISGAKRNTSN